MIKTFEEWCGEKGIKIEEVSANLLPTAYKVWGTECYHEAKELKAENAALRERLSKAVELPCKVGETVYEIIDGEIRETEVIQLKIDNMGLWITIRMGFGVSTVLFNKVARIYLTREAAETRLKELQGEEK